MSTLTVLMPPRDAAASPQTWQLPSLRFVLVDRRGKTLQSGTAPLALLPKAVVTTLILAARDVLLIDAVVPPLAGTRLRQALPNIAEDQLLPDGPPSHIALGPGAPGSGKVSTRRTLAAVDRGWLRFLLESFTQAGHRHLRAVPLVACLPMARHDPVLAETRAVDGRGSIGGVIEERTIAEGNDTENQAELDAAATLAREQAELHAMQRLAASATVLIVGDDAGGLTSSGRARDAFATESLGSSPLHDDQLSPPSATLASTGFVELAIRRLPIQPLPGKPNVTVAIAPRLSGEGMLLPIDALRGTLVTVLPADPDAGTSTGTSGFDDNALRGREIYCLTPDPVALKDVTGAAGVTGAAPRFAGALAAPPLIQRLASAGVPARPLAFDELALAARESHFDLCQFEFAAQPWRPSADTFRQLRLPVGLLLASLLITVIGINVQWAQLARERGAVQSRMTELLLEAFPKTTVVLDPPAQMTRSLGALRIAAGELSPDDFLTLVNGLSGSLGAIPAAAIETMTYDRHTLQLTFKPAVTVDSDFAQRLSRNSLEGTHDGQRWTIRSAR